MKAVGNNFYRLSLKERQRLLADAGFVRDADHIWSHLDGRAIGEGVAAALTDEALLRYLRIDPTSMLQNNARKRKARPRRVGK
jgi:hypothetical protein